jgi:uncharacterized protein (DUF302 family)
MSGASHGVIDVRSRHSVAKSLDRLEALVRGKGMLVFARIDFRADAERAGLTMRPLQQIVFGDPKAGTPLLAAAPRVALDLPLHAIAWEDEAGAVWISLNDAAYVGERHGLSADLTARIAGARGLIERAASDEG